MKQKAMSYLTDEMRNVVVSFYKVCEGQSDYRPKDKALKEQEVMMLWKLGYGHMGEYMEGKNPSPSKENKATKDTWEIKPMLSDDISQEEEHKKGTNRDYCEVFKD